MQNPLKTVGDKVRQESRFGEEGSVSIKSIISVIAGVVVFTALMPLIYDALGSVDPAGATGTLIDLIPLFLILGVVISVIAWGISEIRGTTSIRAVGARFHNAKFVKSLKRQWNVAKKMAEAKTGFSMSSMSHGQVNISSLISAIIIVAVGVFLFPIVSDQVSGLVGDNVELENTYIESGTAEATLVNLIPLFYVLALVFLAIGWALKSVGRL